MDASSSWSSEYNDRVALEGLLDAFGSVSSLEEIASAYCKAGRNADMAAEILYGWQERDVAHAPDGECTSANSQEVLVEKNSEKSTNLKKNSRGSKQKKVSFSIGTVSSVMGRGYVRPTSSRNDSCKAIKLSKLELKEPSTDELQRDINDCAPRNEPMNNKDIEGFLFAMLGDGFQLGMDVIQQVLGYCGYDAKKSMDKLLDLSTTTLDKGKHILGDATRNLPDMCSKESLLSNEGLLSKDFAQRDGAMCRNGTESPCMDEGKYNLSREVLEALFNVPERFEEAPKRNRPLRPVKRTRAIGQVVTAPLVGIEDPLPVIVEQEDKEESKEDNYQVFRRAAKENWDKMKTCYGAALDAFLKGDSANANYFLEEGKTYNKKAREADEESHGEILKTRNVDVQNVVTLDLHDHHSKEAIRLLKLHLSKLANIPSIQFLKIILETDTDNISKGARKRLVMKLLEKNNIKWMEEGTTGTISIRMDEIDPENLSFAKLQA